MAIASAPRSTGFALARPASRPRLDPSRIATLSGTLALNALALGLLMMPISMAPPAVSIDEKPDMTAREIPPEKKTVEVDIRKALPQPEARPVRTPPVATPRPPSVAETTPVAVPFAAATADVGELPASDPGPAVEAMPEAGPAVVPAVQRMTLAVIDNPAPAYPRRALQQQLSGTVLLEILVGIDGQPLQVTVVDGSGHRILDEAAREQVLRRWRFQPANVGGQPVQALGRVPITFSLER